MNKAYFLRSPDLLGCRQAASWELAVQPCAWHSASLAAVPAYTDFPGVSGWESAPGQIWNKYNPPYKLHERNWLLREREERLLFSLIGPVKICLFLCHTFVCVLVLYFYTNSICPHSAQILEHPFLSRYLFKMPFKHWGCICLHYRLWQLLLNIHHPLFKKSPLISPLSA